MNSATPLIVADIGNSALKLAIAERDQEGNVLLSPKLQWLHGQFDAGELADWAPKESATWCIASVHRGKAAALKEWIAELRSDHQVFELAHNDLSLRIEVDAPEKVGIDRLLTAVSANRRRSPNSAAITITAGTAVTVNAIDATGTFLGGAILPGWPLLAKSLHQYTDALPLVNDLSATEQASSTPPIELSAIGKNTGDAIRSGLYYGLRGAVEALVAEFEDAWDANMEVFISGGDAARLHAALGWGTLAPDLVLEGVAIVGLTRVAKS